MSGKYLKMLYITDVVMIILLPMHYKWYLNSASQSMKEARIL